MFYIKNDDIEDMFRKAADEYELNEEMAADWSKIQYAMPDEKEFVPPVKKEKKRMLYLLWFLLLISVIAILTYKTGLFSAGKNESKTSVIAIQADNDNREKSQDKNNLLSKDNANSTIKKQNNTSLQRTNNYNKKFFTKDEFTSRQNQLLPSVNNATGNNNNNDNNDLFNSPGNPSINNNLPQRSVAGNNNNDELSKENLSNLNLNNQQLLPLNNTIKNEAVQSNTSKPKRKNNNNNYTREAFFYTGLIGNADLSFVKFQRASSLGYGLGVIGGYHFKNGLSVETGLLYDKKNYFTKGEYFDKAKLPYLQTVNLLSANGNCHMWEIPVNFKYDFIARKNHNWFITTGLSSYIMNREYYNFQYEKDGAVNEKSYKYYNASRNWFSVLNVGGGINIKTSDKSFLQVQPYYKVPLSGVGKGSLSLSSAGINLSLTRRLR
jgi:hypothetical protein